MKTIKILFAIDGLRSGGKERRFLSLLKKLKFDMDFECEVIIFNNDVHYVEVFNLDLKIHFLIRSKSKDLSVFKKFYKIAKDFQPDIIHTWDTLSNLYAIPAAKILKAKLITGKITDAPPIYNKLSTFGILSELCFMTANLILANSNAGINAYDVRKDKSQVIYNGFDFNRISNLLSKQSTKDLLGIKEDLVVTMVASFSENKDFDTFLSAAVMIKSQTDSISIVCVGDGPQRMELEIFYKKYGVLFLGRRGDVENIMNASDIGVLMSNNNKHGEGISNSLMEFMALGKPVIASNNGGNTELILNNETGYVLQCNDPKTLSEAILDLARCSEKRLRMGLAAKDRIIKYFSIDRMVKEFKVIYKDVK